MKIINKLRKDGNTMKRNDDVIEVVEKEDSMPMEHRLILGLGGMVLCMVFILLVMFTINKKSETVTFTNDEIKMIQNLDKQIKSDVGEDAQITVQKDRYGNMTFGWDE
jgi:flagellar biogenesis protein FliO